ncbi:replication endonuclease [Bowmanella denitrificans]|uniref:replication endonuclease n=1 Tax=Bowmanella denitrificans TaxID=366582 RepID=UPI000C9CF131|nr:replication endonuclease [Bowmanella denitrificans]
MHTTHPLPTPFIPALHQHLAQWPRFTSWQTPKGEVTYAKPDLFASQGEKALWKLGDDADRYHRAKVLRPLPTTVGNAVASVYRDLFNTNNKQKDQGQARRRANHFLTSIYNRHLSKKLARLCQNPLIFKPSEMVLEDELGDLTFGRAPELRSLNKAFNEKRKDALWCMLERVDCVNQQEIVAHIVPVLRTQGEAEDGQPDRQHQTDARHLHEFWQRSDNELRDYAFDMVRLTYQFMLRLMRAGENYYSNEALTVRIYRVLCSIPNQMGITEKYQAIPFEDLTQEHAEIGLNRLLCEKWWLRKLRTVHRQKFEEIAIAAGVVHNGKQPYISNDTFRYYQKREAENRKVLNDMVAYNEETGVEVPLMSLIEKSVANPKIRRHELMVRIRGNEEFATANGHSGMMITLTAPSRYHPTATKNLFGKRCTIANPKYDGATPRQTNAYLNHIWALIRSALDRFGIKPYGLRVVEPHEDETPHHHYLLFSRPEDQAKIVEVFKHYGLLVDGNEAGAKRNRVHVVYIDPKKGSATGYIAKYISKNIDGYQADGTELDGDNLGNSASDAAKRVTAWRKCWGIRAFQFVGNPSVTVWRELRKYNREEATPWRAAIKTEQLYANRTTLCNAHVATWLDKSAAQHAEQERKNGQQYSLHNGHVVVYTSSTSQARRERAKAQYFAPCNAHVQAYLATLRPKGCPDETIEAARMWADTGHWDKYMQAMGGVFVRHDHRPVQLLRPQEPVINRYGEALPHKAIGVQSHTAAIITSGQSWSLHRKGESPRARGEAPVLAAAQRAGAGSQAAASVAAAAPRSAVNNCTPGPAQPPGETASAVPNPQEFNYPAPPQMPAAAAEKPKPPGNSYQSPFPPPPQMPAAAAITSKIPIADQPIAEFLLAQGINPALLRGYIARLREGKDLVLNKNEGWRLVTQPDGSLHLVPVRYYLQRDLMEDWPDEDDIYDELEDVA